MYEALIKFPTHKEGGEEEEDKEEEKGRRRRTNLKHSALK